MNTSFESSQLVQDRVQRFPGFASQSEQDPEILYLHSQKSVSSIVAVAQATT